MSSFSQRDLCDLRFLRIFLKNTLAYDTCGSSVVGSRVFLQPFRASATGQAAERLVVGRDTMQLFALLLATADSAVLARLEKRLDELDASGSTACWRRCIGVWRLDDEGILWLECVNTEDGDVVFSGAELVPEFAAGSRARAGWFSGEIRYGTGNLVYYQHDGFMRNLEREWVAAVSEGRVRETKAYRNRLYERGADATDNAQRVAAAFDSLHVGKSPDLLSLYVVFAADSTGRVVRIDRARLLSEKGSPVVSDPADPLLQAALQAFRSVSRWDAWWVGGTWKEQAYFIPLRRAGTVWKPRRG